MGGVGHQLVGDAGGVQLGRWGGLGFVKTRMDAGAHTPCPRGAPHLWPVAGKGRRPLWTAPAREMGGGDRGREGSKERGGVGCGEQGAST